MTLEQKCKHCMIKNKGVECPFYNDCLRELKTGMCV